jgi:hypothetical protein
MPSINAPKKTGAAGQLPKPPASQKTGSNGTKSVTRNANKAVNRAQTVNFAGSKADNDKTSKASDDSTTPTKAKPGDKSVGIYASPEKKKAGSPDSADGSDGSLRHIVSI